MPGTRPPDPTPEAVAFEKFLYCAVPGLAKMKDAQALLEFWPTSVSRRTRWRS